MESIEPEYRQGNGDVVSGSPKDRSFGGLLKDLSRETITLVRQEAEFAKVEMSGRAASATRDTITLFMGGAVAFAGFLSIMAAVTVALAHFMPLGWSMLLVGSITSVVGIILLLVARHRMRKHDFLPWRTLDIVREDKERVKSRLS